MTIGELTRKTELIHRDDEWQRKLLEQRYRPLLVEYGGYIFEMAAEIAQIWDSGKFHIRKMRSISKLQLPRRFAV